ncbi:MAG TPA: sodium:solute symporter [Rhizomicrobium sp.]|nr:sodium:solute symporter [Rhizomicrobium sp.]
MTRNSTALAVFLVLFVSVALLGFVAARWQQSGEAQISEWGLGGRRFGTLITWFLLGGDLYTAYTFIAVPTALFGQGAAGFFAVPYTIFVYPILFAVFPRLWSVARKNGYVTAADFVRGRFGSGALALAVAVTGIIATMPYIALQLVGMEVVLGGLGIHGHWPLVIAFATVAAFTYTSGLRAPAIIAIAKDLLIYITVIAAVLIIPGELGGYAKIFAAVPKAKLLLAPPSEGNLGQGFGYATLALGSALALFLYPHAVTGLFGSASRHVVRRNAVILPAYSLALGLIALLGTMALASGVASMPAYAREFKLFGANFAVPALFLQMFPAWFVGVAFAAIVIGALVPAAIMSIASANLFTRNIYREYLNPGCSPANELQVAKLAALAVLLGALGFIVWLPGAQKFAITLQLLGGIWIIQTLPAVLIGLYTRWLHPVALLVGWAVGIVSGTAMVAAKAFASPIYPLDIFGVIAPSYDAISALALNLVISVALSFVFNAAFGSARADATAVTDYV